MNAIRPDIKAAIDRYVQQRTPVGGFLTAVLENNLTEAFARADDYNRETLFDIVSYCWNDIPAVCWGSPVKVRKWLQGEEKFVVRPPR